MGTTNGFRRPERVRDRESGAERYDVERLQRRVLEGVQHWVNVANRVFANERNMPLPVPECRFDLLGTCAGQACFPRRGGGPAYIRINVDLLERYPVEMLMETLPHECAHVVQRHIWGDCQAHGKEWKSVMKAFGKKPTRLHDMTVKPEDASGPPYHCGCTDRAHYLTDKHQRLIDAGKDLKCSRCGQPLVPATNDASGTPVPPPDQDRPSPEYRPSYAAPSPAERERLRKLGYLP